MKKIIIVLTAFICYSGLQAQSWSELGTGSNALNPTSSINSIVTDRQGNVYAAVGGAVAKWNGTSWNELGTGANAFNPNGVINSIAVDGSGNVYAGGDFYLIDSTQSGLILSYNYYVAKWNGASWSELGPGLGALAANNPINTIVVDDSGNVYAAGQFVDYDTNFYVAIWNGAYWNELGQIDANNFINTVVTDHAGNVYATGWFTYDSSQYYVAKWNGLLWSELGTGSNALNPVGGYINTIEVDRAENVYAAGGFTNASGNYYVAIWNGTNWTELGGTNALGANGAINSIAVDDSGNVYAAGGFTNANGKEYVAKWNGSYWSALGVGSSALNADSWILIIVADSSGNVYATGDFTDANHKLYVAKWSPTAIPTGINAPIGLADMAIYPNPAAGMVNVTVPENGQLGIYNTLGELIYTQQLTNRNSSVNLGNTPSGIYTLVFTGQNTTYAPVKLVKE